MRILISTLALLLFTSASFAQTSIEDQKFLDSLKLDEFKTLSIQHNQTVKTLDSFARQMLTTITGRRSYQGQPAVYTVLDMTFRPEKYHDLNIIKIKNAVLRQDFMMVEHLPDAEKQRIRDEGTISLATWLDPRTQKVMADLQSSAVFKAKAVGQLQEAAVTLQALAEPDLHSYHVFAPATAEASDHLWKCMSEFYGTLPSLIEYTRQHNIPTSAKLPGYEGRYDTIERCIVAITFLRDAWRGRDADTANKCIDTLVTYLPQVNAAVYPSAIKRKAEVIYNRLAQLTIPGIMLYFVAMVLFLLSARSGIASLRLWGLRVMTVAVLVHTAGIGVRWWLVQKSVGNYFEAIPIKNMFESVMFSAWFGALIGLILEMRRSRGLFGAAAAFVGTAAMVALFAVPYFVRDIGGEISQVQGVLMSYWLYIHVTMVTASYALIGMSFLLSAWWLWSYYRDYARTKKIANPAQLSSDAARDFDVIPTAGGAVQLGFMSTLASMVFLRRPAAAAVAAPKSSEQTATQRFLATLDACNLVVLQLVFWMLGIGIVLGAVWADMSWGRPWAWDAKETFALVTWIIYVIVVHVRVATIDKAWWTSVLSIFGFAAMLFNWIGVNFFLESLHSYA